MDVLLLSVPPQDSFDNPLVERNPRIVSKWLDQLPLLNPAETIMQLLNALRPLNRQPLTEKDRLRMLELYREAVNAVFNAFTLRALRQVPLAAARREQIKQSLTQLCLELAGGYKSLLLPAYQQGRSPAQEPTLLLAAYCAMEQLIHTLLHCFRIYEPVPPRVYLEIHQLYAWVEEAGVCEQPIRLERETVRLGALYRRALLLCCADPARLSEDEVLRVYALLAHYEAHSQVVVGRCTPPHEGRFAFDLYADAPPRPCAKYDGQGHSSQPRLLDARDVAAAVRAHTQSENATTADEERRLLRMLLPHLESTPQRIQPRQNKQAHALVASGIAAIYYYLSDPRRLKQDIAQASQGIAVQHIEATDVDHHSLDAWSIGNESENGYLLKCARRQTALRVGELLGVILLERTDTVAALELTVMRWMRNSEDGGLEVGVERIHGAAAPVQCRLLSDAAISRQCLFLPSSSRQDRHATLLAPKRFYARGQRLHVEVGGKPIIVEAGHLVMDTACFDRFVFHAQGEGAETPP
jgi:cyclic-di-GMP-binding protein